MQPSLFDLPTAPKPRRASVQRENLERVGSRIAASIVEYLSKLGVGSTFHADELASFVQRRVKAAPGSSDRILRELKRAKRVNYTVLSRSKSLYRVEPI